MSGKRGTDIDHVSQEDAARAIGMGPRWFRQFLDAPRNSDKSYSIPMVVAWWFAKKMAEVERDSIGDADPDSELAQAKLKQIQVNTEIAELKLAQSRGELLPASEVKMATARAAEQCKRTLLALPPKLAPLLVGRPVEEIAQEIDAGVRDCLDELSEGLRVSEQGEVKEAV